MSNMEYLEYAEHPDYEQAFNVDQIRETLGLLALQHASFVVIGGANLVLRDIKPSTPDIDLLVSHHAFGRLKRHQDAQVSGPPESARLNGADNQSVHIASEGLVPTTAFTYVSGNGYYPMSFSKIKATAETVDNISIASLNEVIASKQALARPKDITDLQTIAHVMNRVIIIPQQKSDDWDEYLS